LGLIFLGRDILQGVQTEYFLPPELLDRLGIGFYIDCEAGNVSPDVAPPVYPGRAGLMALRSRSDCMTVAMGFCPW